jgi:Family of unknown function (DUF6328)
MAHERDSAEGQKQRLSLSEAAQYLLDECRMVLPGIQTLFGFQLIVVFNSGFDQKLSATEQHLHLIAIVLVATAVAIIMTPAAYNRQTTPMEVTDDFVRVSTRLLLWSMFPLAVGISLDLYLIGRVIAGSIGGGVLSAGVFAVYVMLWFLLPRVRLIRRLIRSPK